MPSLTATRSDTRPATANGTFTNGNFDTELGVGVRWGITPDVTADLAINPDFSQVEADVAQLSENTEFALFYPETRPFFLEGSDYYDSPLPAVYTRTIADPDLGAKLTGRLGPNTFGTFVTRDAVTNLLFPGPLGSSTTSLAQPNDGIVGRYTRGYGNASTIGALFTLRHGDGYTNDVGGIDGRYRINDQNFLRFQYLTSRTEYPVDVATESISRPVDSTATRTGSSTAMALATGIRTISTSDAIRVFARTRASSRASISCRTTSRRGTSGRDRVAGGPSCVRART